MIDEPPWINYMYPGYELPAGTLYILYSSTTCARVSQVYAYIDLCISQVLRLRRGCAVALFRLFHSALALCLCSGLKCVIATFATVEMSPACTSWLPSSIWLSTLERGWPLRVGLWRKQTREESSQTPSKQHKSAATAFSGEARAYMLSVTCCIMRVTTSRPPV